MFESSHLGGKVFAEGEDFVAPWVQSITTAELEFPLVHGRLEFQGNLGFLSLDDQKGQNSFEKIGSDLAAYAPDVLIPMNFVPGRMAIDVDGTAVGFLQRFDDRQERHADAAEQVVSDMNAVGLLPSVDADIALSVEQTGSVAIVKHVASRQVLNGIVANSVETRCPARKSAEGQYRAKQEASGLPGACNEQGPLAEAKVCSELHGNMESPAETTGTDGVAIHDGLHSQVTDCNTDYIYYRPSSERDMYVPEDDRVPINQDAIVKPILWAGNMTVSNRRLQGVLYA